MNKKSLEDLIYIVDPKVAVFRQFVENPNRPLPYKDKFLRDVIRNRREFEKRNEVHKF